MRLWCALSLTLLALMLAACGGRFPDYHYKMTVYVDTPEGEKAFSSVVEVSNKEIPTLIRSSGKMLQTRVHGEALIIDRGAGTAPVFVLLASPATGEFYARAAEHALRPTRAGDELGGDEAYARWMQRMIATKGARELPRLRRRVSREKGMQDQWPTFVAFNDINDPSTVYEVRPEDIGVKRITIEITDEPASDEIEKRLPWLDRYDEENRRLNGRNNAAIGTSELSDNLASGAFRQ